MIQKKGGSAPAAAGLVSAASEERVRQAYQTGMPLTITSYTLPHEQEVELERALGVFLRLAGQEEIKDYVTYCVQELASNAKKANTKRVYFEEKGLDLNESADYAKGMATFKKETLANIEHYLQAQERKRLYVKIVLLFRKDSVHIEVRNNSIISRMELIRIHDKMARSRRYQSMEDAFTHVLDDSEGAGLGLVVLVLVLRKLGLDEDAFGISATETETVARLVIPFQKTSLESMESLTCKIVESINMMPQFPDNIRAIQSLLADPKSEMTEIALRISEDPAMSADLIKLVNSAQYMMVKQVDNIKQAITIVGQKGVRNLLYSYGTQKVLGGDEGDKRTLWKHCYKTAFYAYNLIKHCSKDQSALDDVYLGGMLHDMGKIVLSKTNPAMIRTMAAFCADRAIPQSTLEDIAAGMNHAEIGARIAEKWNFPPNLAAMIRFHHDPTSAPGETRPVVDAVYLANMLCEYEKGRAGFYEIDASVLGEFGLTTAAQIDAALARFNACLPGTASFAVSL